MWGLLLRGVPLAEKLKDALAFAWNHKLGIGTLIGVPTLLAMSDNNEQPKPKSTPTPPSQPQSKKKEQIPYIQPPPPLPLPPPPPPINTEPPLLPPPPPPTDTEQKPTKKENDWLSEISSRLEEMYAELDKQRQIYEALTQQYLQANDIYEKQLLQTMQAIPLLLAKTPLSNITTEDLNQHITTLLSSMPYSLAIGKVNSIVKGYYLAKFNGLDTQSLTTTDLETIAENPVLARSVDENIAQFLEQIGEIVKYKIDTNIKSIGAIKDMYQNTLKMMEEKAKLYKSLIDAYKFENRLDFDMEKLFEEMQYKYKKLDADTQYKYKKLDAEMQYKYKKLDADTQYRYDRLNAEMYKSLRKNNKQPSLEEAINDLGE